MAFIGGINSDELVPPEDETVTTRPQKKKGKRLMAEMTAFAPEDRLASKRMVTYLKDERGSPSTREHKQRWWDVFENYIVNICGEDIKKTPTPRTFERFWAQTIQRLKSHIIGKQSVSRSTFLAGTTLLESRLTFEYPDFKISDHYRARMEALITSLTNQGKLTEARWSKAQFIGFITLRKLLTSWIAHGLSRGVCSWDTHISRMLSILLQSSLDSRSGEVAQSSLYTGLEYLKWDDIQLTIRGESIFENIEAEVTIRWEKSSKHNPNKYRKVYWKPLVEPRSAVADPIVLLLVHALRTGQAPGTTLDEIIRSMEAHAFGFLQWKNPKLPVIAAITRNGELNSEKPARVTQITDSARMIGETAGMFEALKPHDLRRGCAKDLKFLEKINAGVPKEVADALGHSGNSSLHGVTDKYGERASYYLPSAKEAQLQESRWDNPIALQPFKPPSKQVKTQMYQEIQRSNPELKRDQIFVRLHKQLRDEWKAKQEQLLSNLPKRENGNERSVLDQRTENEINMINAAIYSTGAQINAKTPQNKVASSQSQRALLSAAQGDSNSGRRASQAAIQTRSRTSGPQLRTVEDASIDPSLLELDTTSELRPPTTQSISSSTLENTPSGPESHSIESTDGNGAHHGTSASLEPFHDSAAEQLLKMISSQPPRSEPALNAGGYSAADNEIPTWSGEPNTEGNQLNADEQDEELNEDQQDLFLDALNLFESNDHVSMDCHATQFIKTFSRINLVLCTTSHVAVTSDYLLALGRASGNSRDPPTQFYSHCTHAEFGCQYKSFLPRKTALHEVDCPYRSLLAMQFHLQKHDRSEIKEPLHCEVCDKPFLSQDSLASHVRYTHDAADNGFIPKSCDKGCTSGFVYTTFERYIDHVRFFHPAEDSFPPQQCELKAECGYEGFFSIRKYYRNHLRAKHGLDATQRTEFVANAKTKTGTVLPKYKPGPCPLGDCNMTFSDIPDRYHLVRHLMSRAHDMSEMDANTIAGWHTSNTTPATQIIATTQDNDATQSTVVDPNSGVLRSTNYAPNADDTSATGYRCPLPCLKSDHRFPSRSTLKAHLITKTHGLPPEEAIRLSGLKPLKPLQSNQHLCPLGNCALARRPFTDRAGLRAHLRAKPHNCSVEESNRLSGMTARNSSSESTAKGRGSNSAGLTHEDESDSQLSDVNDDLSEPEDLANADSE